MLREPYRDIIACRAKLQRLGWRMNEIAGDGGLKLVGTRDSDTFVCIGGSSLVLWNGAIECAETMDTGTEREARAKE